MRVGATSAIPFLKGAATEKNLDRRELFLYSYKYQNILVRVIMIIKTSKEDNSDWKRISLLMYSGIIYHNRRSL